MIGQGGAAARNGQGFIRRAARVADTIRAALNRRTLARLSTSTQRLFVEPVILGRGNVEHYYHFLFDLVLPLFLLDRTAAPGATFVVRDPGPCGTHLAPLFSKRVEIVPRSHAEGPAKRLPLIGLDPRSVLLARTVLAGFAAAVRDRLGVVPPPEPTGVILIERGPPDAYFHSQAEIPTAGASRRSIVNHADLAEALRATVRAPLVFSNLQLERMPLAEQVAAFAGARVVVGQHGAGLANILWMQPGSLVVELSHDTSRDHFRIIAERMRLRHLTYPVDGRHATIDVEAFCRWLTCHLAGLRMVGRRTFGSGEDA